MFRSETGLFLHALRFGLFGREADLFGASCVQPLLLQALGRDALGLGFLFQPPCFRKALGFACRVVRRRGFRAGKVAVLAEVEIGQLAVLDLHVLQLDRVGHGRSGRRRRNRLGQAVAQCDQARREGRAGRYLRRGRVQGDHGGADQFAELADRRDAIAAGTFLCRQQAADVGFRRAQGVGDRGHFGHRERAVHRMHRAQQCVACRCRCGMCFRHPGIDRGEVAGHLGIKDFQQQRVHGCRQRFHRGGFSNRHIDGCGFDGCCFNASGRRRKLFLCGRPGERFLAIGDAIGQGLHAFQVRAHRRRAT